MLISGACQESTPSPQERGKKMRRKRFQKGSLQNRKHGQDHPCGWPSGGRMAAGGPRSWGIARRCRRRKRKRFSLLLSATINSGVTRMAEAGVHVRAVHQRRVPAVLPSQLEGIDRGHLGADREVASHPGVREGSAACNPARGVAGFSRPESAGFVFQPGGPSAVVSERDLQTRHVGRVGANNPAAELRIPRKCQPGREMRPLTEEEVNKYSGGLRPPREVDREARDLRGHASRRDPGAPMEVGGWGNNSGGAARVQAGARTRRRMARPAKAPSRTARCRIAEAVGRTWRRTRRRMGSCSPRRKS